MSFTDGRSIRGGSLLRGAAPTNCQLYADLHAQGVRSAFDVRSDYEAWDSLGPQIFETDIALELVNFQLSPPGYWHWHRQLGTDWRLSSPLYYSELVIRWPVRLHIALRLLIDAPPGGVFVHCVDGRTRTGLLVAVLLDAIGVPADAIVDDHWESYLRTAPPEEHLVAASAGVLPLTRRRHKAMMHEFLSIEPGRRCLEQRNADPVALRERLLERFGTT